MKVSTSTLATTVIALLTAATLALAAWRYNVAAEHSVAERRALETSRDELEKTQTALDGAVAKARQQQQALDAAVAKSEDYQRAQRARAARSSTLAYALAAASPVKTAMAEYYLTEGKWPQSNADIGMPGPAALATTSVRSISVRPNGQLELAFVDAGKPATVLLDATVNGAGMVSWTCTSATIRDVARVLSACSYRPRR